jgi:hypothetical protein
MRPTGEIAMTKAAPALTCRRRLTTRVVLCVAVVGVLVTGGGNGSGSRHRAMPISGTNFTITSPTSGPVVYLGAPPSLFPITITNPMSAAIMVTSVTMTLTTMMPAGCPASDFAVNGVGFAAPTNSVTLSPLLTVAPNTSATLSPATTLALVDTHLNQDACKSLSLAFTYSGQASYA